MRAGMRLMILLIRLSLPPLGTFSAQILQVTVAIEQGGNDSRWAKLELRAKDAAKTRYCIFGS